MINEVMLTLTDFDGNAATIDLYENEKVHLNYRFTDLTNFSSVGNYSREFRIPASKTNVEFFGAIFNVNFEGWFDFRKKVTATLTVNTIPIASGHVQVKKLYWQSGKLFEFEVVFFGEVPNLARLLNEKKIRDIESIVEGDLDYDLLYENVVTPPNDHTILTLCDKWNLTATNTQGLPVYATSIPYTLKAGHLTPAVSAYYLFDQILKDAGIQWTSANLEGCLENVYVPFVNGQYLNSNLGLNDIASQLALASDVNNISFTPSSNIYNLYANYAEYVDEGNDWSSGIYTAPFSGNFSFNIWANGNAYTPDFPSAVVNELLSYFLIYVNDIWVDQTYFNTTSGTGNTPFNNFVTKTITLNEGDTLKIKFKGISGGTSINTFKIDFTGNGIGDYTGTGIELVSVGTALVGDTCVMRGNAPDMKQIDFLTSIQKMFNLVFVADRSLPNTLKIEPLIEYIGSGNTLDWTDKLDISKDISYYSTVDLQKSKFSFTYSEDGDYYNSLYKDNGHIFGTYQVSENDFEIINEFATGEEKVELSFAPTPCVQIPGTDCLVPTFLNAQGDFVQPKPRILYYFAQFFVNVYRETTNSIVSTPVRFLSNYSTVNPSVTDKDLNFAPEIALHPIIAPPYNNLYNVWWRNYYRELYDGQARIMEGMFNLSLSDIFSFQWSDKIWIVDSWWRILDVEGYVVGEQEMTKVKLIRVLDINNDCDLVPVSANLDQTMNWETPNGDPATPTEDCCDRFGYYWNTAKNNCFSRPNNGTRSFITAQAPTLAPTQFGAPVSFNASMTQPLRTITTDHVITDSDRVLIADETAGNITIYLPSATTTIGREMIIQNKTGVNDVIITPYSGEYINGSLSLVLTTARQTVTLISDGSDFTTTTAK
jgi:hypothetical protein